MLLLPLVLFLHAAASPSPAGDPPGRVARVSALVGTVSVQLSDASDWSEATLNSALTTGDRIYTDQGSRAELQVGRFTVRLADSTDLTVTNLDDHFMQLGLAQGTVRVTLYRLADDDSVEVDTPNGAITPLAVGAYRVAVSTSDNSTLVSVERGRIEVSGGGTVEGVESGQAVQLTGTDSIQVADVEVPSQDEFDQWSTDRDRRIAASPSAQFVSPDVPGYDDLDDAGRWDVVAEYGPVWYPVGVAVDWVPYRYGHWVWLEPWGWTWVEDEPWGFVPFHYGRWVYIGAAWAWVPGPVVVRPCWAPALVAFVDGSPFAGGGGVAAWFPLGPREPYFPWYHHSLDYRLRVNETNLRNVPNVAELVRRRSVTTIPYVNRQVATTVVPTEAFRSGQPIARHVMPIRPEQAARAPVTPHPTVMPGPGARGGGPPAPRALVVARPRMEAGPPRPVTRLPRVNPLPPVLRRNPAPPAGPSPPERRPPALVVRRPAPPPNLPFTARQPAMAAHPGRPLEPQQVQNLRAGRPPGPMRDQEVPPHPAPRAAPHPAPAPRPAGKRP